MQSRATDHCISLRYTLVKSPVYVLVSALLHLSLLTIDQGTDIKFVPVENHKIQFLVNLEPVISIYGFGKTVDNAHVVLFHATR